MARKKTTKTCGGCRQTKDCDAFGKDRSSKDGLQRRCRDCRGKFFQAHSERYSAYAGLRYAKMRADEFPDRQAYHRRFLKLRAAFVKKYGEIRIGRQREPKSAEEKRIEKLQRLEEMFNKVLEYERSSWRR